MSDPHDALRALQRDYAARLPARAAELGVRFEALARDWSPDEALELRRQAHNLAGSGASYGFPAVSQAARRVERALDAALDVAPGPAPAALAAVAEALAALHAAATAARAD